MNLQIIFIFKRHDGKVVETNSGHVNITRLLKVVIEVFLLLHFVHWMHFSR